MATVDPAVTAACGHCGAPAAPDFRYCSACGEPVGDPAAGTALTTAARAGAGRGWRPHRPAFLLGAVAAILTVGIVVIAVRAVAGGGSSPSPAGAHAWPASVETAFLADCGRSSPPQGHYCGCALERVEAHVSVTAYLPLAQQLDTTGTVPHAIRALEAPCRR